MTPSATVIAYHAIGDCPRKADVNNLFVKRESFRAQMEFLARHRTVLALESVVAGDVPEGPHAVAITFDDGYVSVLQEAAPVLSAHGFKATVFVPTRWIGERNRWDDPGPCDLSIMTAEQLREVESLGVAVESHGHAHIDMGSASSDEVTKDIQQSLEILSNMLNRRPRYLAYPFGLSSADTHTAAGEIGLEAAFSIDALHAGPFAYKRVQITPLDGPRLFALKTSGRYMSLRKSRLVSAGYAVVRPVVRRVLRG